MPLSRVGSVQRLRPQRIARPAVKGAPSFHSGVLGLLTLTRKPSERRMESFGVLMIPFFAQKAFVSGLASLTLQNGSLVPPSLPDGLFFGGGVSALNQLGIEAYGVVVVMISVFILSYVTSWVISIAMRGITPGTTKN